MAQAAPQGIAANDATIRTVNRHAAINNSLELALHIVRQPICTAFDLQRATARATRAASMLKQACAESNQHAGGL